MKDRHQIFQNVQHFQQVQHAAKTNPQVVVTDSTPTEPPPPAEEVPIFSPIEEKKIPVSSSVSNSVSGSITLKKNK